MGEISGCGVVEETVGIVDSCRALAPAYVSFLVSGRVYVVGVSIGVSIEGESYQHTKVNEYEYAAKDISALSVVRVPRPVLNIFKTIWLSHLCFYFKVSVYGCS